MQRFIHHGEQAMPGHKVYAADKWTRLRAVALVCVSAGTSQSKGLMNAIGTALTGSVVGIPTKPFEISDVI